MKATRHTLLATASLCASIIASPVVLADAIPTQGDWTTTLQARYIGDTTTPNAYYDTSQGITWLADANASGTAMTWADAMNWATNLNINGVAGWSLPTTLSTTCDANLYSGGNCGYNVDTSSSEMAHMFYVTLGNKAFEDTSGYLPQPGWGLTNTGPFSNLVADSYWSATQYSPNFYAWKFDFGYGGQYNGVIEYLPAFAWAVHTGDIGSVSPVPVPAAALLFGSGLLTLFGTARRKAT